MSTDPKLVCASCNAAYVAANCPAKFACDQCGAMIVNSAKGASPTATPVAKPVARIVAKPTAVPVAKPVVAPAATARPVAAAAATPTAASDSAEPSRAVPGPRSRTEGGRAHTRVMSVPAPDFSSKTKAPVLALLGVGVLAICVAGFFIFKGDGEGDGGSKPALDSGKGAEGGGVMKSGAETPAVAGIPPTEPTKTAEAAPPQDAASVKYEDQLLPFLTAPFVSEYEREEIGRFHQFLTAAAAANGGFVKKKDFDAKAGPVLEKYADLRKRYDELAASPFGVAAAALAASTIADLEKAFEGQAKFQWFIHPDFKPYLVVLEESPAWIPVRVVQSDVYRPLSELHELFLQQYQVSNGLTRLTDPVPVVFFESKTRYEKYNETIGFTDKNVLAHFEPTSGRLVLHRDCTHRTIMHEGTHQLFSRYAKNKVFHTKQSYWFEEGIAEWFGGANRLPTSDGKWRYEIGVIQGGRINAMRGTVPDRYFTLKELTNLTYADRDRWKKEGGEGKARSILVYEQGWFLIFFLNYFDVDSSGYVKIGVKGRYADGWDKYVKGELSGKTGRAAFEEALGLDSDAKWAEMQDYYIKYFDFVNRKISLKYVKDDRLIPWNEYRNKRGEAVGEQVDDLLVAPKRKDDEVKEDG